MRGVGWFRWGGREDGGMALADGSGGCCITLAFLGLQALVRVDMIPFFFFFFHLYRYTP